MTDRIDEQALPKNIPVPVDEELERERLEPGLNTDGTGDVGADPRRRKDQDNSNT